MRQKSKRKLWLEKWKINGVHRCYWCGIILCRNKKKRLIEKRLTSDHVIPKWIIIKRMMRFNDYRISLGKYTDNEVPCCYECNSLRSKFDTHLSDLYLRREKGALTIEWETRLINKLGSAFVQLSLD